MDKNNITAYMPDQQFENMPNNAQNPYHPGNFKYDQKDDCYTCPQSDILKFHHHYQSERYKQQAKVYQATACKTCAVRSLCTSSTYRTIHRELREHLRQQSRNRLSTPEGKRLYQQRQYTIEPIWGNLKFNRKFTMFSLRGRKKVNGEFNLLSIAENILKVFNHKLKLQEI